MMPDYTGDISSAEETDSDTGSNYIEDTEME
jgi:hypothetical protein